MSQWYILYNGQQIGPMDKEQLLAYNITPNSQVWTEGMPQWAPAYTIPELMTFIKEHESSRPRTVAPGSTMIVEGQSSGKSKVAAGILAILLGGLGIQYFYIGKIGGGFITILLTLVTCGLWEIVTLVQGILMLTMSDADFDRKFVNTTSTFPLF